MYESVLVVFPIWYSVFTGFSLEREMMLHVNPVDLLVVMIGEAIFVTLFAMGIQFDRKSMFWRRQVASVPSDRERLFLSFLVGAGLLIYLIEFTAPPTSFQLFKAYSEGRYFSNTASMLFAWFRGFFQFACLVGSCLVLLKTNREKEYSMLLRLMAASTLVLVALIGFSVGLRGRILWVVSLLAIVGFVKGRKEPFYIAPVLVGVIIPFFVFLGGTARSIHFSQTYQWTSRLDLLNAIVREAGNYITERGPYGSSNESFIEDFAHRAQAPRNSIVLYRLYRQGSSAGFRPLSAAMVTAVPRIIWPGKGVAGSVDSTTYGAAVYLVRRLGYGAPWYNMGPYLASAHAYWEGGWVWLVFAGFVTGLIWNLILRWCDQSGKAISIVVALTLTGGVLANGLLTALQPLFDFVRLFWVTVLPTIILSKTVDIILTIKKSLSMPQTESKKRIIRVQGQ